MEWTPEGTLLPRNQFKIKLVIEKSEMRGTFHFSETLRYQKIFEAGSVYSVDICAVPSNFHQRIVLEGVLIILLFIFHATCLWSNNMLSSVTRGSGI